MNKILSLKDIKEKSLDDITELYRQGYCLQGSNIRIGHQRTDLHLAVFVAERMGLFEKYGIKANLILFGSGPVEMQFMSHNDIDAAYVGIRPTLVYIDRNKGTDISAHIITGAESGGIGIIVKKDSDIQSISDLKGKTVGVLAIGSIQDYILRDALVNVGIQPYDVNIIAVDIASIPNAVESGFIDAGFTAQPFISDGVMSHNCRVLAWVDDLLPPNLKGVFINILAVRDDFASKNPQLVSNLLKIHVEATEFIINNPDKAAEIASFYIGVSQDVEKDSLTHICFSAIPSQEDIDKVIGLAQDMKRTNSLKNDLTKDDIFDLRYIREDYRNLI